MRVIAPIALLAGSASANFLKQTTLAVEKANPGEWFTTCADKGGLITPWYDPAASESVPVFCVTATVCEGHLGRKDQDTALPVTVFDRTTKLRVEQKSCVEKGETQCCTDVLATESPADCSAGNAPCKLGDAAKFSDYASYTQEFEDDATSFKDDCTNKTPTTDCEATIAEKKVDPPSM